MEEDGDSDLAVNHVSKRSRYNKNVVGPFDNADSDLAVNHVSKRSRYNKNVVVPFDNADRMDYLSGFRKRKDKRRQTALQQKAHKDRQKRLQDRRERRAALKGTADGDTTSGNGEDGGQVTDDMAEGDDLISENEPRDVSGTATYEDRETTTTVRVTTIGGSEEEDGGLTEDASGYRVSESQNRVHATNSKKLKPEKIKFKKKKKFQSEKRRRKLTRREKSVPRNMRSKSKKR